MTPSPITAKHFGNKFLDSIGIPMDFETLLCFNLIKAKKELKFSSFFLYKVTIILSPLAFQSSLTVPLPHIHSLTMSSLKIPCNVSSRLFGKSNLANS